jgi:translation initiation factor 2B subunit (eIF-2B alpha/beta/delta family)
MVAGVVDGIAELEGEVENIAASLGASGTDHIRPGEAVMIYGCSETVLSWLQESSKVRYIKEQSRRKGGKERQRG